MLPAELRAIHAELEKRASEQEADKLEAEAEANNAQAEADRQKADAARMKEGALAEAGDLLKTAMRFRTGADQRAVKQLERDLDKLVGNFFDYAELDDASNAIQAFVDAVSHLDSSAQERAETGSGGSGPSWY